MCHQTKYLDVVFAGLARQTRRPDLIVVSCDTDLEAIGDVCAEWAPRCGVPVSWVRRAHHGIARCSQVRNNAARHVIHDLGISSGRLIQLDADMLATPPLVERHAEMGRDAELVFPHRTDVPRDVSESLDALKVLAGEQMPSATGADLAALAKRARRYRRQLLMRRLRLGPAHKPKLLGSNWSASIETWIRVNGFDEHYQGWGFLDDEFARRAVRDGARVAVAVQEIIGFHLWHATRQPSGPMSDNPNYRRFMAKGLPVAAEHGLKNPIAQNKVKVTRFGD